jgi:hypothetical protein
MIYFLVIFKIFDNIRYVNYEFGCLGMPPRLLRPPGPPPRLPAGIPLPGLPLPASTNPIASGPTSLSSIPIPPGPSAPLTSNPNVLSAAPQLINRARAEGAAAEGKKQHGATIEAKPQIRYVFKVIISYITYL